MSLSNAGTKTIHEFLSGNIFYIPNYQREYSWEKDELEDFWDDLQETINSSEIADHFFGQIVVHNAEEDEKHYIIDGQQRTITSIIFLSVLRKHFSDLYALDSSIEEADYKKADITSLYIGRINELRLILGELDKDYFINNIQTGTPGSQAVKKKSHKRLKNAFSFFDKQISDLLKEEKDTHIQYSILFELLDTFTKHFVILYLEETKLDQAFVIFETLNARGKDLETSDLLKNYFFSKAPNNITTSQAKWDSMLQKLDGADPTKFIRHYWNSRYEMTGEKTLYRTISKKVTTQRDSRELLNNLESTADLYHDLAFPKESTRFTNPTLINSLTVLDMLKASSFYTIFLALASNDSYKENDYAKIATTIEKYIFRNSTICKRTANKTEVFFSKIARDIYGEEYQTVDEICSAISANMVTDEEFVNTFSVFSRSNKDVIRYIFRKIHNYLDPDSELNTDNMVVHIEHIMPDALVNIFRTAFIIFRQ